MRLFLCFAFLLVIASALELQRPTFDQIQEHFGGTAERSGRRNT